MEKGVFWDVASTDMEIGDIREYKVAPIIVFSKYDQVKTSNVFKDNVNTESSSNNPDEFKMLLMNLYPIFRSDILKTINENMIESGVHYCFEDIYHEYFQNNQHMAAQLLQRLLRDYYTDARVVKAILHIVSHYSYEEIGDDFVFPISSLLSHENKAIRKFALKVFDNWDSKDTLKVLQGTMAMREKWLEEYRKRIINRLEKEGNNAILFTCNK